MSARALDESLALTRMAIEIDPSDSEHHMLLGKILDRNGLFPEAIEAFNQAVRLQTE